MLVGAVPVGAVPVGAVPLGRGVPLGWVPVGVVSVGAVPPAPVCVGDAAPVTVPLRMCLGPGFLNLSLFRGGRFAFCTVGAELPVTAIRSPLLADDACGEEDVARRSETTRAEAWA